MPAAAVTAPLAPLQQQEERVVRLAAEQGHTGAQYRLGDFYRFGMGGRQSNVDAYVWLSLAARGGHAKADQERRQLAGHMTPEELAEAETQLQER